MTFAAESGLFALSITVLGDRADRSGRRRSVTTSAGLLQGLLVLWAYLDFMQLLIVWQSDLPKEAAWYIVRSSGGWGAVAGDDRARRISCCRSSRLLITAACAARVAASSPSPAC